jgi:RNA polymerase sigma-70 factor (ECF subfamily)
VDTAAPRIQPGGDTTPSADAASDELVRRAKRGDRRALDALIEKHMPAVYRLTALRLGPGDPAVDDVAQEALVAAASTIARLRGDTEGELVAWMLTIARHKVADHLRRNATRATDPIEGLPADPAGGVSPEDVVAADTRRAAVRQALASLTAEQEEIVVLKFVMGYSNEEVAAITRRTVGAVKSMQHRALASLGRLLGDEVEV